MRLSTASLTPRRGSVNGELHVAYATLTQVAAWNGLYIPFNPMVSARRKSCGALIFVLNFCKVSGAAMADMMLVSLLALAVAPGSVHSLGEFLGRNLFC